MLCRGENSCEGSGRAFAKSEAALQRAHLALLFFIYALFNSQVLFEWLFLWNSRGFWLAFGRHSLRSRASYD